MDELLVTVPSQYDLSSIIPNRCPAFISKRTQTVLLDIFTGKYNTLYVDESSIPHGANRKYTKPIFSEFKKRFQSAIESSKRNQIKGFDSFYRTDICLGCTQFIDSLYIQYHSNIQVLEKEYNYHKFLNPNLEFAKVGELNPDKILIISLPFSHGRTHDRMNEILEECLKKDISVHIDAAWLPSARNIKLDLSHPSIKSVGSSLSKSYGTSGWCRIGLRWTKTLNIDSITIMNDYIQTHSQSVVIGNYMLEHLNFDHLWDDNEENYSKICQDFNLIETDTIHIALQQDGSNLGIAPLLRYLDSNTNI